MFTARPGTDRLASRAGRPESWLTLTSCHCPAVCLVFGGHSTSVGCQECGHTFLGSPASPVNGTAQDGPNDLQRTFLLQEREVGVWEQASRPGGCWERCHGQPWNLAAGTSRVRPTYPSGADPAICSLGEPLHAGWAWRRQSTQASHQPVPEVGSHCLGPLPPQHSTWPMAI